MALQVHEQQPGAGTGLGVGHHHHAALLKLSMLCVCTHTPGRSLQSRARCTAVDGETASAGVSAIMQSQFTQIQAGNSHRYEAAAVVTGSMHIHRLPPVMWLSLLRELLVAQDLVQDPMTGNLVRHNKGCNCKKSGCLKKYCECFQANILCSDMCKCVDCKNFEVRFSSLARLLLLADRHLHACIRPCSRRHRVWSGINSRMSLAWQSWRCGLPVQRHQAAAPAGHSPCMPQLLGHTPVFLASPAVPPTAPDS